MDMRIPFKVSAKGVKDTDKARSKLVRFIHIVKQSQDSRTNSKEKTVKKRTIFIEEDTEIFINGKNTMSVRTVHKLKGHGSSAVNSIFGTTGRTESAFTTERDKFEVTAMFATEHSTAERRISAVNHSIYVFNNGFPRVKQIDKFFIMFFENLL